MLGNLVNKCIKINLLMKKVKKKIHLKDFVILILKIANPQNCSYGKPMYHFNNIWASKEDDNVMCLKTTQLLSLRIS